MEGGNGGAGPGRPRVETRGYEWLSLRDREARDRFGHALCPKDSHF